MQQFMQQTPSNMLVAFGFGYSAQALARRLSARGWACLGTVRTPDKANALNTGSQAAQVVSLADRFPVPAGAHWLISAPPGGEGCPIYNRFKTEADTAATITYLSTTGVYGDLQGGWAFEWTAPAPASARAKRRVLAERQWQSTGRPCRIVRLPGIYGPGRAPFKRLRTGTAQAIIKAGQVFSRVHVDDIACGLEAMMDRPEALGVFHLCDDTPAAPQEVIAYAARLIGMTAPDPVAFETAALSPMARSFYAECKRVSNARAKSALGWFPVYKNYKTGLKQVLQAEQRAKADIDE